MTLNNNKRDNDKAIMFILFIVIIITLFCCSAHYNYNKTHYKTIAVVDSIEANEVLMVDPCGDIWAVDHVDNIKVGDFVELTFYNNNTNTTHHDDVVTNVRAID